ncbi:DUF6874 family protein [Acetobacter ascendens]|uniref:DUF6874 domain-containing protein n=1 Tax=Acetobacter ascendens TaxID=481146 RepID=A0A1Y0V756_9PROT|nr:hypothetical protein [Acetobacter ascendens]ARW11719.1 hypothetical protein S101447_02681 [Acetobacter ascendens]
MTRSASPSRPEQYVFSHVEDKAILRIIRRVVDHFQIKETPRRNKVYDLTNKLLRVCHSRVCNLDLEGMANAQDFQLVLDDLGTLKRNLNTKTAHMDYGTRLHFALNAVYRRKEQAA